MVSRAPAPTAASGVIASAAGSAWVLKKIDSSGTCKKVLSYSIQNR
jgi:hypothetical protein